MPHDAERSVRTPVVSVFKRNRPTPTGEFFGQFEGPLYGFCTAVGEVHLIERLRQQLGQACGQLNLRVLYVFAVHHQVHIAVHLLVNGAAHRGVAVAHIAHTNA